MKKPNYFFDREAKILLLISFVCLLSMGITLIVGYSICPNGEFPNYYWFIVTGFIVFFVFSILSYFVRIIKNK